MTCRLKEKGRTFRESFLAKLCLLLRGTVAAPPERFGETLADEHIRGGEHVHQSIALLIPQQSGLSVGAAKIVCLTQEAVTSQQLAH